ncbi:MAG: transposase [Symploca sp. SIO2E6]|nr:transposase [Symploca sp. SIO2E6]
MLFLLLSVAKDISVAHEQMKTILNHSSVPWKDKLSVLVADSLYSQRSFLGEQVKHNNLVTITRVKSNRVFYRQFVPEDSLLNPPGHPRWYGDKFDLKDETTWHEPDQVTQSTFTTKRGRELNLKISGWKQMLMRGTSDYPMHDYPFTLLQIVVSDETGQVVWKPMWLLVIGHRCDELSLVECYEAYRQRYDLEHLFRFAKQKLLMNSYSTPSLHHEENWFQLTLLAYVNLWKARKLATILPRPWETYLKTTESVKTTPSLVQRDFYRIISSLGTPAQSPKRRGYSPGRFKGEKKVHRARHQVIKKQSKHQKQKIKVPYFLLCNSLR